MLLSIIVGSGMTSCSSDDDPSETVISQLEQKLIGGMWLDGSLEKGNLVTLTMPPSSFFSHPMGVEETICRRT